MADPTPKSPVPMVVALCAGAVALIAAIVAGPTVFDCTSSDNFGACMQQGLAQRGLVSGGDASQGVEMDASAEADDTSQKLAAVPEAAETPQADMLTFGLRAEPDGSVVIAGSGGEPGAEVKVYANGQLLGTAKAAPSGDWVLVPDEPLATGGVEISVGSAQTGDLAEQSVVVVIQEDRTSEPLVMASTPGTASQILQGETASQGAKTSVGAAPEMDVASTPAEKTTPAAAEPEKPEAPVSVAAAAKSLTPPTIDAIEVDGTRNFYAGGGEEGASVRLYVNDAFVADSTVEGGRWLIETEENLLTDPSQRVRIDMLQTGSSDVAARAEVNFDIAPIEQPALAEAKHAEPIEVAKAPESAMPATTAADSISQINAAAADNAAALLASPPPVTTASVPKPDAAPEMATPPVEQPKPEPQMAAKPEMETPAAPEKMAEPQQVAKTKSPAPEMDVAKPTPEETAAAPEIPTMTASPVGDDEDQRFVSGNAIIRRGDNLWTIALRVYGDGDRYTTIYEANQDQIRDPDLIYPGQVFDLPEAGE